MSDRMRGCVVTFEEDVSEETAEAIMYAIQQIRGVAGTAAEVTEVRDHMARQRVRSEVGEKLLELYKEIV